MPKLKARKAVKKSSVGEPPSTDTTSPTTKTVMPPQPEPSTDPRLPPLEVALCLVVGGGLLSTAFYNVYISSQEHAADFGSYILKPGWLPLGSKYKDYSDFEWSYWTAFVTPLLLLMVLGHMSLGQVVQHFWPQFKKHFLLVYALACLSILFGLRAVAVYILYTAACFLASRTKSVALVWITVLLGILSIGMSDFTVYLRALFPSEEIYNHVNYGLSLCLCRLLSFSLEYCKHAKRPDKPGTHHTPDTSDCWGFFDVMLYNFYLPFFLSGPLLTYDKFAAQINQAPRPLTRGEAQRIVKEFARYIFWALFTEVALHYLYFPAFHQLYYIFQFLPTWSLAGVGLCHLLFFQVKYLVTYGLPRAIALCDRIEAPLPPICVLAMYTFQDMWKYFDRGLHAFFISTIYIPMGGSRHGRPRMLLASMLCFLFVFVWHGMDNHIFYWALINWLGIVTEILVQDSVQWLGIETFLKRTLPPSVYCRLFGFILTPNFMALALSNLIFLGGVPVAKVYYYRLIEDGWPWPLITTFTAYYCVLQVTKAAHQHFGKTYLCKKLYAS